MRKKDWKSGLHFLFTGALQRMLSAFFTFAAHRSEKPSSSNACFLALSSRSALKTDQTIVLKAILPPINTAQFTGFERKDTPRFARRTEAIEGSTNPKEPTAIK